MKKILIPMLALILGACSQAPASATSTPLSSITPTHISTVTSTVLPTFTPITLEQLANMKKQAKEKLGDLADIDEKDMQYLPLGYIVSGRTITTAELLLVPEKSDPEISNLYLLTLIGVDKDGDPDQFSNVKEIFSPIYTDVKANVVFTDPETGESSIWMSPVPGDDEKMQMFVLGFDGELSDTSVILPITLTLPKGAGKNSAPVSVNAKSGINFTDGESGPEYIHNNVTYRLDTAKGAWVEVPKVDLKEFFYLGENKELQVSLEDTLLKFPSRDVQLTYNESMAGKLRDIVIKYMWILDNGHRSEVGDQLRTYADYVKAIPEDGIVDQSCILVPSDPKIKIVGNIVCKNEKVDLNTVRVRTSVPGSAFDTKPATGGLQVDGMWWNLQIIDGTPVFAATPIMSKESIYLDVPYVINENLSDEEIIERYNLMFKALEKDMDEFVDYDLNQLNKRYKMNNTLMLSNASGKMTDPMDFVLWDVFTGGSELKESEEVPEWLSEYMVASAQ